MKIAIFHNLPTGGAKRSLYEWVKRLSLQHHFDLFTYSSTSETYLDIRPYMKNVNVYGNALPNSSGYNLITKAMLLKNLASATRLMASDIQKGGYDFIFVHHCVYIQSPLILKYTNIPKLYFCQEPFRRVYEPRPLKKDSLKSLLKDLLIRATDMVLKRIDSANAHAADMVLANSNYSRDYISKAYQISAITNYLGVDVSLFKPIHQSKGNEILSVGRLNPIKGHDFVIQSLGLIENHIRPNLKIICDSSNQAYKDYLIKLAHNSHVQCDFQEVSGNQMPNIYNTAVLTVFAPILEPLGLVPIESMACGVPVVGIREAGIRETIRDNETGLLTERNPQEFADAIKELITNPKKRKEMGLAGSCYVRQEWSWERSTERLEKQMIYLIDSQKVQT